MPQAAEPAATALLIEADIAAFEAVVATLRTGDPARPLFVPRTDAIAAQFAELVVAYRNGNPVRLRDVGRVKDDVQNNRVAAWFNDTRSVTLAVQNMTCELCPITVKKSLEKVPGVSAVKVDFDRKTAIVTYDADKAQPEALTKATTNAGYPSTVQK